MASTLRRCPSLRCHSHLLVLSTRSTVRPVLMTSPLSVAILRVAQDGRTALHLASLGGYTEVARALLRKGARTDVRDKVRTRQHGGYPPRGVEAVAPLAPSAPPPQPCTHSGWRAHAKHAVHRLLGILLCKLYPCTFNAHVALDNPCRRAPPPTTTPSRSTPPSHRCWAAPRRQAPAPRPPPPPPPPAPPCPATPPAPPPPCPLAHWPGQQDPTCSPPPHPLTPSCQRPLPPQPSSRGPPPSPASCTTTPTYPPLKAPPHPPPQPAQIRTHTRSSPAAPLLLPRTPPLQPTHNSRTHPQQRAPRRTTTPRLLQLRHPRCRTRTAADPRVRPLRHRRSPRTRRTLRFRDCRMTSRSRQRSRSLAVTALVTAAAAVGGLYRPHRLRHHRSRGRSRRQLKLQPLLRRCRGRRRRHNPRCRSSTVTVEAQWPDSRSSLLQRRMTGVGANRRRRRTGETNRVRRKREVGPATVSCGSGTMRRRVSL